MQFGKYARVSQSDDRDEGAESLGMGLTYPPINENGSVSNHAELPVDSNREEGGIKKKSLMPHVYYDDGPFDAPSSDSEEDTLLEKGGDERRNPRSPGAAEVGLGLAGMLALGEPKRRPSTLRYLVIALASLLFLAVMIGIIAAHTYKGSYYSRGRGSRHITMDHVFNGTFYASRKELRWVPEAGDGVYAEKDDERGAIILVDLKTNSSRDLVSIKDIKSERGLPLLISEWKLSPDMKYMLVKTDYKKQWRHSSFGNYYVHDIAERSTHPLIPPSHPPTTAYATWSPVGEAIAYVKENDLYIVPDAKPFTRSIRLTTTGSTTLFHGVPDWVYEEEVFSSDFVLWWSPDARKVAFLSSDESDVDEYVFPIYNPSSDSWKVYPYTEEVTMKYPKPGYANPLVEVRVFDLGSYLDSNDEDEDEDEDIGGLNQTDWDEANEAYSTRQASINAHLANLTWSSRRSLNESIIFDVSWVGPDDLLVKEVNRAADDGVVVHFDITNLGRRQEVTGNVVRRLGKNGEEGDDGWIPSTQSIVPLAPELLRTLSFSAPAYLDLVNNSDGYTHIALFSSADSGSPIYITTGDWEVDGNILGVDPKGVLYFTAAYPTPVERAIFAAPIPAQSSAGSASNVALEGRVTELTVLTDTSTLAWYEASFSPEAGFYLLSYRGPNVPWQSVLRVGFGREEYEKKVTENTALNQTISEYQSPLIVHSTIENDGFELSAMEILPPSFDDSGRTKYPVLFRVYGGPNSQLVNTQFNRDWHTYLACSLKYIIVVVDGRGTGYRGRGMRNVVRNRLGEWEVKDQIEAARIWASKKYVDPKKIGIWGWSYGGYMSSKVVEANAGIHSLAMAVAPVTSWRLYDSIYTERYMSLPALNADGYANSSVSSMAGFLNTNFLLAHGSGDDNVHFANSAHLLDMFTRARVRNFRFRMFTDSDHSIGTRGAYRELHEYMTSFLLEKWGKGGIRRGW